jgi:protein-disulfide isomerase
MSRRSSAPAPLPPAARPRGRILAIAVGAATAVTVALVAASQLGGGAPTGSTSTAAPVETGLLAGIPQRGNELGAADAPVTLVEYADLQCPYCAEYANDVLPDLIRTYVRPGHVKLVFRGLAFIGPDSATALRAVAASGRQNRLWNMLAALYAAQGPENSGWVTPDRLRELGRAVPGLDEEKMLAEAGDGEVTQTLAGYARAAAADGVRSTPSFVVGPTGGRLEPLHIAALDPAAFAPTLDGLLAE